MSLLTTFAFAKAKPPLAAHPDWAYVEKHLRKAHFRPGFIKALGKSYENEGFEQSLELNTLLFLRKHDDHGAQVSDQAVESVKDFIRANEQSLKTAEKKYGVSPSVIASLLWIESRYGENRGKFHVPSVYAHLLQAPRPEVVAHLKASARKFASHVRPRDLKEIEKRAAKKAAWALAELKALEKIHAKDPAQLKILRGSFAGAFGIPQFVPSSYLRWARAAKGTTSPDLNRREDAILSVAYYLKSSGWRSGKAKTFTRALKRYNNSDDYARAILRIAAKAEEKETRVPASRLKKRRR